MEKTLIKVKSLLRLVVVLLCAVAILFVLNIGLQLNRTLQSKFRFNTTNSWKPKNIKEDTPEGLKGEKIRYGYELITNTANYIGPLTSKNSATYTGNYLTCNNCHLDAGQKKGAGSFIGITRRFPQFRGRENKIGTLEERINGCMERSMNGRPLPSGSPILEAMIAYMEWLSEDVPKEISASFKGFPSINIPNEEADPILGKTLYQANCQVCHSENGIGLKRNGDSPEGYLYPPLAGPDSFNDGAGMNRVLTAARFIKGNMPLGATVESPKLTDQQAYHIAAFINSLERPSKQNKENDFPDLTLKPVSTPYGPWADPFSAEQHKYGPFQPLFYYYEKEYGIIKTK